MNIIDERSDHMVADLTFMYEPLGDDNAEPLPLGWYGWKCRPILGWHLGWHMSSVARPLDVFNRSWTTVPNAPRIDVYNCDLYVGGRRIARGASAP